MKVAENVRKNWEILFFAKKIERFAEQKTEEIFFRYFLMDTQNIDRKRFFLFSKKATCAIICV